MHLLWLNAASYSPVNHIGWVVEGIEIFWEIVEGYRIVLKPIDD